MVIKFFVYSLILLLFSFLVFRVVIRNDYLNKQKLSPFSYSLETVVFALYANFIYLFIPLKWPYLPSLPEDISLKLISIGVMCIGLLILIIAWFGLGSAPSFGLDKNKLKSSGIYKYSRNPQLVGYGMFLIVFVILFLSWYSIGWFITYLVISYFMIRSEEEFLELKYGEEYEKYRSVVPRIIKLF
jgi:protein-S-isoprenylcysteine O-methyltransferase Ste14